LPDVFDHDLSIDTCLFSSKGSVWSKKLQQAPPPEARPRLPTSVGGTRWSHLPGVLLSRVPTRQRLPHRHSSGETAHGCCCSGVVVVGVGAVVGIVTVVVIIVVLVVVGSGSNSNTGISSSS